MISQSLSPDRAAEYIYGVAAAESDAHGINNAHSLEGGHRAEIDYSAIYARQNGKEAGQ